MSSKIPHSGICHAHVFLLIASRFHGLLICYDVDMLRVTLFDEFKLPQSLILLPSSPLDLTSYIILAC
jgi:hypothetical protein